MNDTALSVEIVESQEDLLGDLLDEWCGDTAVVPSLDEAQQVLAKDFKDHADVSSVGTLVLKRVE